MYTHMKQLIRWTAFIGLVVPPTALAAIALQLPADAIAGLGFDLLVDGLRGGDTAAIRMETPDGESVALRGKADATGLASLPVRGDLTEHAGSYLFIAEDGTEAMIDVVPDTIDPVLSTIDVWTPRIDADGSDAASVTVTLRDRYGNPLPGRIATLLGSRSDDEVTAESHETDDAGEQHFSVRSYDEGTLSLRAIDLLSGMALAESATIRSGDAAMGGEEQDAPVSRTVGGNRYYYAQVAGFDVVEGFEITAPESLPLGEEASKITIRAVDRDGNTVEDYLGTVVFSSTDPEAALPNFGRYVFKARDLGEKEFPLVLKFKSAGEQTFRAEDENDRTIFGDVTIEVGGHGSADGEIVVTSPKDGDIVNARTVTIAGTGPAFTNLVVLGGATDTPGSSDRDGNFSIPVTLRSDLRDYTIRVQDEDGRFDSGPIILRFDDTGPAIGTVTFTPAQPVEGDKVLAVVKSEPGLASVVLTITQRVTGAVQEITLNPTQTASGTYQAFFTAPVNDTYQPKILATDTAGNTSELRATLTVGTPSLAVVTGVVTEARVNAVEVRWNELDEEVDGYRVYVGEKPDAFDFSLDTKQKTDRATIAGLGAGKKYFFAVTALEGERESKDKSAVADATVIGMTLTATPGDRSLRLNWTALDSDTPLAHFLLEFGPDEAHLTEQRLLNRALTEVELKDLIGGVSYTLRLTPVTTTGKKMPELSALTRGTPADTGGFHPGADDPVPFDINNHPGQLPYIAPATPASGMKAIIGWVLAAAGIGGAWLHLRRKAERKRTAAFLASLPLAR